MRRLTYSGLGSAIVFGCVSFGYNLFRVQDRVCGTPLLQPAISDVCGALRLGDRPTKAERIAWAARKPGSCADLRTHIERFPNGAYAAEAATMLAARRVTQTEVWTPTTRRLALFEPQADVAFPNKTAAQADARARAQADAERKCREFAATTLFRLKSATPAPQVWNCSPTGKGLACGFEGDAVCELEERRIQEQETCGKSLRCGGFAPISPACSAKQTITIDKRTHFVDTGEGQPPFGAELGRFRKGELSTK